LEELAVLVSQVLGALPFMTINSFPVLFIRNAAVHSFFSCCCYIFLSNYLDPEGTICAYRREILQAY
jgi:hypothetical protein